MADTGTLLLSAGVVTRDDLSAAREQAQQHGGTIAEYLVLAGAVNDEELTLFYQQQLMIPKVRKAELAKIAARVVKIVPADMATEFRVMPISIDQEQNLTLAMSDPGHRGALDEIGFFTGNYIVRAVATQAQLAWCLGHYYGHITLLGETLLQEEQSEGEPLAISETSPKSKTSVSVPVEKNSNLTITEKIPRDAASPYSEEADLSDKSGVFNIRKPTASQSVADPDGSPSIVIDAAALEEAKPEAPTEVGTESKPILLQKKPKKDEDEDEDEEVVLLVKPKSKTNQRGSSRETDLGVAVGTAKARRPSTLPPEPPVSDSVIVSAQAFLKEDEDTPPSSPDESKANLVTTLRELAKATERDEVIALLADHLANDCERVAFFVLKDGHLTVFSSPFLDGIASKTNPDARMRLGQESTFEELIETALPFHGSLKDDASTQFVCNALGEAPNRKSVIIPLTLRSKVVGLLYGDKERHRIETEHVAAATRAAGVALERIVKSLKS